MFLRNDKPDPKQQAIDNVLMMLVHKKMSAPVREKRSMTPSYPPARNGATNFEPSFNPKPVSRKGGTANPDIMTALKTYMSGVEQPSSDGPLPSQMQPNPFITRLIANQTGGKFNPNVPLDASQVQDMRTGEYNDLQPYGNTLERWIARQNAGPFRSGPLSRTKGKGLGPDGVLREDGGFNPQPAALQTILKMLRRRGAFAGDGYLERPGPLFRNGE